MNFIRTNDLSRKVIKSGTKPNKWGDIYARFSMEGKSGEVRVTKYSHPSHGTGDTRPEVNWYGTGTNFEEAEEFLAIFLEALTFAQELENK